MVLNISNKSDLQKFHSDKTETHTINCPGLTPKEIVKFVLKYEEKGDVYVKTDNISCISKNKWLIFKKKDVGASPRYYRLKRVTDVILGTLLFIASLPIFIITFILVKLNSKGAVIFRQQRVNNNMCTFDLYKFRTMRENEGEKLHQEYMKKNINGKCNDQKVYKLIDDPRTTTIGKWLRKLSIDELPQILNVLKGDMTLVGPRPPIPYEVESYKKWHFARFSAKPGITGIWQIMGRSLIPFDEMVMLDLYYASNQSLWLDIKILLHTIPTVLSLRGAF
ncbi:sugar transferase [candidate division WOR-3 bacterium]|nr:sugar transferase [candidate division WOR-3 bacterium]